MMTLYMSRGWVGRERYSLFKCRSLWLCYQFCMMRNKSPRVLTERGNRRQSSAEISRLSILNRTDSELPRCKGGAKVSWKGTCSPGAGAQAGALGG